jgi:integrase
VSTALRIASIMIVAKAVLIGVVYWRRAEILGRPLHIGADCGRAPKAPRALPDIELPPIGKTEQQYLTHQHVQELAVACGRFRTLVLVLALCGLRFGEAVALRRKHVDLKAARIWVKASATHVARKGIDESDTKTHEDRKVPIPASVLELLRTELPDDAEPLVFPGRKRGFLPLGEFRWAFDQAVHGTDRDRCAAPAGDRRGPRGGHA